VRCLDGPALRDPSGRATPQTPPQDQRSSAIAEAASIPPNMPASFPPRRRPHGHSDRPDSGYIDCPQTSYNRPMPVNPAGSAGRSPRPQDASGRRAVQQDQTRVGESRLSLDPPMIMMW